MADLRIKVARNPGISY